MAFKKALLKYEKPEDMPVDNKPQHWEDWEPNVQFGPVEYRIKPSTHLRHCRLLNFRIPYFETGWNLFPWEIGGWARAITKGVGRLNGGIQPYFKQEFFGPALVGQPLFQTHYNLERSEKRGKVYFSVMTETKDETGKVLCRINGAQVFVAAANPKDYKFSSTHKIGEGSWNDMGEDVFANKDLPIGTVLLTRTKGPLPMRVSGYDRGGWHADQWKNNIHVDEFASKYGYKGGVVEGPIAWEYGQFEQLSLFFGPDNIYHTGVVDVKVCGPGYLGDTLIAKARVKDKIIEKGATRLVLETRIENPDGFLCNIGTVSALVD